MSRKFIFLAFAMALASATGCSFSKTARETAPFAMAQLQESPGPTQRYIAERHKVEVITSESQLQKSWESAVTFCGTIRCEIISSNITTRAAASMPSGGISLRVAPEDFTKLLAYVEKLGRVAQHTTEREDKTTSVVDTEAKIKNLTTFRDNLRAMFAKPSSTVRDLVEVQKQLTDTQAELDSETAKRKILANETEKIAVEISFRVESPSQNAMSQIWNAFKESGSILADSTAALITTIVAVIPWLILIVPAFWLLARLWRKLKLRRSRSAVPAVSQTND